MSALPVLHLESISCYVRKQNATEDNITIDTIGKLHVYMYIFRNPVKGKKLYT